MKDKTGEKLQTDNKDKSAAGCDHSQSKLKWSDAAARAAEELENGKVVDDQAVSLMKDHAAG